VRPQFSTAEFAALNKNQRNKELLQKLQVMIICADASKRKRKRKRRRRRRREESRTSQKMSVAGQSEEFAQTPVCMLSSLNK
jgi:hypothetical protein